MQGSFVMLQMDDLRQIVTEGRVHQRSIVREISDGDRVRSLVVDVCSVELV